MQSEWAYFTWTQQLDLLSQPPLDVLADHQTCTCKASSNSSLGTSWLAPSKFRTKWPAKSLSLLVIIVYAVPFVPVTKLHTKVLSLKNWWKYSQDFFMVLYNFSRPQPNKTPDLYLLVPFYRFYGYVCRYHEQHRSSPHFLCEVYRDHELKNNFSLLFYYRKFFGFITLS